MFVYSVALIARAAGQDAGTVLESFENNFDRGTTTIKIQVLNDSLHFPSASMDALYLKALDYLVTNDQTLQSDPAAPSLALIAVKLAGGAKVPQAAAPLWKLFNLQADSPVRVAILGALGQIGEQDPAVVGEMNDWLVSEDNLHEAGNAVDIPVLTACVTALGELRDQSSFPALFTATLEGYPPATTSAAAAALAAVKGSLKDHLIAVIRGSRIADKLPALAMAMAQSAMPDADKAAVASAALQVGLDSTVDSAALTNELNALRFQALKDLAALKWGAATGLVIANFERTLDEYTRGLDAVDDLLDAIDALGAMGTHEAAVRLTLYLDLIHTSTQSGQPTDDRIVSAVIANLSSLGDRVALENLLYTQYLNYSDAVKKAAREAVDELTAQAPQN